ncbi:MAG: hypothetical protein QOK48_1946, partial [Blastocatellia bacterium]|nr:hypothetical protein [Blastocatellia bacterium]
QVTSNILLHLHAAEVVVDPISQETQEQLDVLAAALDDAIARQAWIGASLDMVQALFNTAVQIRKITEMNSNV